MHPFLWKITFPLGFPATTSEYAATLNPQSVTPDVRYASGYWNNLSLRERP